MITQIKVVGIPTTDQDRTLKFKDPDGNQFVLSSS